jgi:NADH-quinone oxidoreductase subunit L
MYYPLVLLAVFAVGVGWPIPYVGVQALLNQAQPAGTLAPSQGELLTDLKYPSEHESHLDKFHVPTEIVATSTALFGFLLAVVFYGLRLLNPNEVRAQFRPIYEFLIHKWYFDELYNALFIQPVLFISRRVAQFDRHVIDRAINRLAASVRGVARLDDMIDRYVVDGAVNVAADWIFGIGVWFHGAETGKLRQYVMFIVVATVALFVLISFYMNSTFAGI